MRSLPVIHAASDRIASQLVLSAGTEEKDEDELLGNSALLLACTYGAPETPRVEHAESTAPWLASNRAQVLYSSYLGRGHVMRGAASPPTLATTHSAEA